jgi:hypothetical protein
MIAVVQGEKFEHVDGSDQPTLVELDVTMKVDSQDGPRFFGSWASKRAGDPLIGVLRADGQHMVMVDDDGTYAAEMTGSDTMEICRTEVTEHSMVVACGAFTRQQ